jgi:acyl transferase domain-containing protein
MDPQQRWILETAYRAFENAGIPAESLKGSRTGVYAAYMSDEYLRMYSMDPDTIPPQGLVGTSPSILPNRVSWFFDLLGPSVYVDTACSGSMVALDLAVQSLRNGDSATALVCAPNLILGPECSMFLSNLNFLSPDGICHSFDHRANGYARGEGVMALVLKPVSDAIRDGDTIRAVIRETGTNQDGRSPTLTQPVAQSQEALIRQVYRRANLGFESTRYFEAHGTGTAIGDPVEMKAIGRIFKSVRSTQEPLYV